MTTREEIEAAAKRYSDNDYPKRCRGNIAAWDEYWQPIQFADDQELLADAYLAECQQRDRDQQPPTREIFERLNVDEDREALCWITDEQCPVLFLYDEEAKLDTIAKLRAACLLLGIDTEGVL